MSAATRSLLAVGLLALLAAATLHLLALLGLERTWGAMVHLTLFGWVTAMIYAISAHVLPVFTGRSFPYPQLGPAQAAALAMGLLLAAGGIIGGSVIVETAGLGLELLATLLAAANVALLLRRGAPRSTRPLPPAIARQSEVDQVATRATRIANLALPIALGLLLAGRCGLLRGEWLLAAEHLAALGWVLLTIAGVAYHMLPRFTGRATRGPAWARAQIHTHMLAVALMAVALGFGWPPLFAVGGLLFAAAMGMFAYAIWPTVLGPLPTAACGPAPAIAPHGASPQPIITLEERTR